MNPKAKTAVGYAFAACVVVFFVALLTVIFSFLGTFICAALAGMMMGAGRIRTFPSMALSLVFPVVLVVTFRVSHTEIMADHILLLALICLGVFWVVYAAVLALTSAEQKPKPTVAARTESVEASGEPGRVKEPQNVLSAATLQGRGTRGESARATPLDPEPTGTVILEALQGTWVARCAGARETFDKKLQIDKGTLLLRCASRNGKTSWVGRAPFRLSETECHLQQCDYERALLDSEPEPNYCI